MAANQKDFEGWEFIFGDGGDQSNSRPRSRRGVTEELSVRRISDGFELKRGDTILIHQDRDESTEVAFIKEFRLSASKFLEMIVIWFIRSKEIDHRKLLETRHDTSYHEYRKNELFITAYTSEAYLKEVIDKVNVLSLKDFKKIVLDDSTADSTYLCRRGSDGYNDVFSPVFDYNRLTSKLNYDPIEFMNHLKSICLPEARSKEKEAEKNKDKDSEIEEEKDDDKAPEEAEKEEEEEEVDDDDDEDADIDEEVNEDDEDDEEEEEEEEEEEADFTPNTRSKLRSKTRTKRKSPSPKKSPAKKVKLPSEMLESLLSPRKVKSGGSKPAPSSLSPKKGGSGKVLGVDSTSQAFRDIKSKLHASHRIASLPGREDEYASLYLNLESAIQEETGCCIYVSGTPGVGKTATVREVIAQLEDSTKAGDVKEFDYLEINGLKLLSPNVAYEVLWQKISGLKVSASNASILLEKYFSEKGDRKPLVILMDELDQIVTKKQNVMYNFFNWPTYANSKLIVIAIANTMDLPERILSNKISSRLGLRRIQFIGYTYEQLGHIIKHRLSESQKVNRMKVVVKEDAISFASRKIASVSGDARRALTICRRGVEIAEYDFLRKEDKSDSVCQVQISHISRAINETVNSPIAAFLSSLSFGAKLLLGAVLLRMKRSGLAENSLGDIIDEMNISIKYFITKDSNHKDLENFNTSLADLLYGSGLVYETEAGISNIRIYHFKQILNELVENGILTQQNILSERYRSIHLNVSEEEVTSVLKRDKEMVGFF
ncbi:origin recognition complex subunit 1 [Scheffersomyces coipomensis]|uniref:origin recognition complex subunit 1 n=1 Tax=Scheffersomyces coipomensis TaxID=1788519 RepID=UPI00315DB35F